MAGEQNEGWEARSSLASPDANTAFDVAKPGVIADILQETEEHGWINAALLEEVKGLKGLAGCTRQGKRENTDAADETGKVCCVECW